MNWDQLASDAAAHGLFLMGGLHEGSETVVLIGADAGMWPTFEASPEARDGRKDPLDRWSKRIFSALAEPRHATAVFPSDGPPYPPFIAWAQSTGRFWQSPTGMLIHDRAGLMISIRGALRLPGLVPLPETTAENPCDTCSDRPCATACPVGALSAEAFYDVPACKGFLATDAGADCMNHGCQARRACPVSAAFDRDPAQSAFHMRAFFGA